MIDHVANRQQVLDALFRELFGPDPSGEPLDTSSGVVHFDTREASFGPWHDKDTGEEILVRDTPTKRYGIGVLYPCESEITEENQRVDDAGLDAVGMLGRAEIEELPLNEELPNGVLQKGLEAVGSVVGNSLGDENAYDLDLSTANAYRPSSIAISFLAAIPYDGHFLIDGEGGRYSPLTVHIGSQAQHWAWWLRHQVRFKAWIEVNKLFGYAGKLEPDGIEVGNAVPLDLELRLYVRPNPLDPDNPNVRLLTLSLVNRTPGNVGQNEGSLFQTKLRATLRSETAGNLNILPYPSQAHEFMDEEEKSMALLYRNFETFAVGHGCAASWDKYPQNRRVEYVSADCLPVFETPSTTPDVTGSTGNKVEVRMGPLAGLDGDDEGYAGLELVVSAYEGWIAARRQELEVLGKKHLEAASRHLEACTDCARRMRGGIEYLRSNPVAQRAFQLANYAILLQQIRAGEPREFIYDGKTGTFDFSKHYPAPDPSEPGPDMGSWRAFQIAFLLMALESTANGLSPERDGVELIWFPTGGGKTEAYLGLAAFAMFMRRLQQPDDFGVDVLMRYTLRLLTTQQFQRAARLICAMEAIRQQHPEELGEAPFSVGLWVGGANTPNTRSEAQRVLRGLAERDRYTDNLFVVDRCPWCGARMGPVGYPRGTPDHAPPVLGYRQRGTTVEFHCPDKQCIFYNRLPVCVIDEDIYDYRPSLVIGTVDKFAVLAWKPEARALFGIDGNGQRTSSPPSLIIQDELHLISGPLGSMVGLYESVIEELCTDRRHPGYPVPPKIVSSTATIRRYGEQIKALYARNKATLFPPPGLEAGDSFFAKYARDGNGNLHPGCIYAGVHAPGLGSLQTVQVRTFTSLLQAPMSLAGEERDPWWTLLIFFNSLRELGTSLTLLQSDIPDYQKAMMQRMGRSQDWRRFREIRELTGRARNDEIPKAIAALEVKYPGDQSHPVDVCLASNILEVGVDIPRLSLMSVVGQPKTTSQYIQVTGRVGRSWWERPGLVVTIYSASKPRDRSHFEKFRSYHEQLYAQVEPTSVTPFSPPALDRALHAIMAIYARQAGDAKQANSPYPFPADLMESFRQILLPRVAFVDEEELENFELVFDRRIEEWRHWQRSQWVASSWSDEDPPLLRSTGAYTSEEKARISWPTPQSMRSVDAECIAEIHIPGAGD